MASSEMYGNIDGKIKLSSPKKPLNPYGEAKLLSFNLVKKFRDQHNLKTYNAITFNTESHLKDKDFLIPKICLAAIRAYKFKTKTTFYNTLAVREWNWCDEQCDFLIKFINKKPQDFILSNGKFFSATILLKYAFGYFKLDYKKFILTNKKFIRKKDSTIKRSNYLKCLKRNKIKRDDKFFGKKIIYTLIKHYLYEKKY